MKQKKQWMEIQGFSLLIGVCLSFFLLQGEVGQSKLSSFPSLEAAKKDFEKKFRDKTKNSWADRENFVAHNGKYTLIEVQQGDEEEQEVTVKVDGRGT